MSVQATVGTRGQFNGEPFLAISKWLLCAVCGTRIHVGDRVVLIVQEPKYGRLRWTELDFAHDRCPEDNTP